MESGSDCSRRSFLGKGSAILAASFAGSSPPLLWGSEDEKEKILPPEDLMREHGVLRRILLIYEELIRRIDANRELQTESAEQTSRIVKNFVEDYHEKLEEDFLFPRFRNKGELVGLVDVLLQQHKAGRKLTASIMQASSQGKGINREGRAGLKKSMQLFIRMYRPHAAREDTVLFPAFRKIISSRELDSLGEKFEKKEDELFGDNGFFRVVDQVAEIEKKLGILDLSLFTPDLKL